MVNELFYLLFFTLKSLIVVVVILLVVAGILALISRGKEKIHGKITIKNLNHKFDETKEILSAEILSKDNYKKFVKSQKSLCKARKKSADVTPQKNIFVLNFNGDIRASAVASLREEVTAVLGVAKPTDEVIVRVESPGGMVHAYGLAAAQLMRIRQQGIPLTVCVDKIAASGGYLMASIANKILAAPFAIIGSIGVIVQIPNFNRLLKENNIDFEQLTAGNYKRTLTIFGHNTEEGREKMRQEIDEIHELFKNVIAEHRQQVDIQKVSTGEHWLGSQALNLKLVDELKTSDDYLMHLADHAQIFEITYQLKKSFMEKMTATANVFKGNIEENSLILPR